jgi:isoleucyl-tRNA synthetase
LQIIKGIDLSELCITSSVEIQENSSEDIFVETNKAEGNKCPVCWKISQKPCERHKD